MLRRRNSSLVILLLLLGDLIFVYLSFTLGAAFRTFLIPWLGGRGLWSSFNLVVGLGTIYLVLIFALSDLYPGYGLTSVTEMERLVKSISVSFILLGITIYILRLFTNFPRSIFLFTWFISIVLLTSWRILFRNRLSLRPFYGSPFILIVNEEEDYSVLEVIRRCRRLGWNADALLTLGSSKSDAVEIEGLHIIDDIRYLKEYVKKRKIDTVFVADKLIDQDSSLLRSLTNNFKRIVLVYPLNDMGSVWVKPLDLEGQLGIELRFHLLEPIAILVKRSVDILLSAILLIVLFPLILLLIIVIRLDSPGQALYGHKRVGQSGKLFSVHKFRTMYIDADERLTQILESDATRRAEFEKHRKIVNDPRVTRVGKWLRKFSLDEIPQFWNVIVGEMSLIGPRAVTQQEVDAYGDKSSIILRVRPGITGWWQVMGRHRTTWEQRVRLEVYYVSNWSLWMDVYITFKTIWVILSGQGA
ncbi:MAG: undecaprenyl-phosphate galactose phosphotransferase WbaP [Chloroflexota bacterium]